MQIARTGTLTIGLDPRCWIIAMTSCCTVGGTDRFFSQNAWLYAARFRIFGLDSVQSWTFHPYYHDPPTIEGMVDTAGFRSVFRARTAPWQVGVYSRQGGAEPKGILSHAG